MGKRDIWAVAGFTCKKGASEEMKKHLRVLVTEVRKEHGCLFDDCLQDAKNPLAFLFVEHWETPEDFDAHVNGAPAKRWAEATGHMIDIPVDIRILKEIWG